MFWQNSYKLRSSIANKQHFLISKCFIFFKMFISKVILSNFSDVLIQEAFVYSRANLIKLQMYIKDPYVSRYLTQEKITEMSFVGGIGGILGLFLGFSFISAAELFSFFASMTKHFLIVRNKLSCLI